MSEITEYPLGTVVTVHGEWDVAGQPEDPTTVTLVVQDPLGIETSTVYPAAPIIKDSTGRYHADLVPDDGGLWHYRWEGSGLASGAQDGQFWIAASFVGAEEYTYDLTTDVGEVRLYIDDRDLSHVTSANPRRRSCIFNDAEIARFITRGGGTMMGASLALRTIAINKALLVQRRTIGKTDVDYGSLRSDLLKAAKEFQEQAAIAGEIVGVAPADGVVEHAWDQFSARDIHWKSVLRGDL